MLTRNNLYDKDFYAWINEQVKKLKEHKFAELDLENLIEEVESMGKREFRELRSRLIQLIMHLLKWKYQPALQSRSWQFSIQNQRQELKTHLEENPSLKNKLENILKDNFKKAVLQASIETSIVESDFPYCCEWTIEQILDEEFLPL